MQFSTVARKPLVSIHFLSSGTAYHVVHVCSEEDTWQHVSERGIAVSDWLFASTCLSQSWPICMRKVWLLPTWFAFVRTITLFCSHISLFAHL